MVIFRWPGGKSKLLKHFRCFLDDILLGATSFHDPFVGGGSVLLDVAKRYPGIPLFANDGDDSIATTWGVISGPEQDVRALETLLLESRPTLDLWHEWKAARPEDPVEVAFSIIYLARTSFDGNLLAGPLGGKKQDIHTIDERYKPKKIVRQIRRAWELLHGRLRVTCCDGVDYINWLIGEDPRPAIYADPPYLGKGRVCYRLAMAWWEHVRLADALARRDRWVLSMDNCRRTRDMYRWAYIHPVSAPHSMGRSTGPRRAGREVIILPRSHPHVRMLNRLAM